MYINPFVAGVIATILVELIIVIGIALYVGNKKKQFTEVYNNGKRKN